MDNLSEHIKEEEKHDLPKLEEALSQEDTAMLELWPNEDVVPLHSHPMHQQAMYEQLWALTAPMDHLADLFRKWPDTAGMPNPSTK